MPDTWTDPAAQDIIDNIAPCATAPNGTGSRCACDYACANYLLRAHGFKAEDHA